MFCRQLFDKESSTFSYLVADFAEKKAILIDPVLECVDRDLALVLELKLDLLYAINTHCHADHITSTGVIKQRLPHVKSAISKSATAIADILLSEGDELRFGSLSLKCIATPGHTAGCLCFYLAQAKMVFTGDTLLIRGCGRTDFQGGSSSDLYDNVHSKLFSLPDDTLVYPAHDYKGHSCSSIGEEKALNPRLTKTKTDFVDLMAKLALPYPKKIDAS
ncbi:Ethylmalonic encephalopathy 1, partial [Kappamyces sp. JEL0680]